MPAQPPATLRRNIADKTLGALVTRDKSLTQRLLAEAFYWRHSLSMLGPIIKNRAFGRLISERRALLQQRMTGFEARLFADHMEQVAQTRDALFLQLDLRALHQKFSAQNAAIDTKSEFALACQRHRLPYVETHVLGADRKLPDGLQLPLFIKPDRANRARGCAVLRSDENGEGAVLTTKNDSKNGTLTALLAGHCLGEALLAQPLIANHTDLAAFAGPVAVTFRMVTGIRAGEVQLLSSLAEIPLDDALPLARKWAVVPVDQDTGCLGKIDPDQNNNPEPHPLTKAQVSGQRIPHWNKAKDLAQKAHGLIAPDVAMVGWDIAICEEGPVLIEGNVNWAVATHCRNASGFSLDAARRFAGFAASLVDSGRAGMPPKGACL